MIDIYRGPYDSPLNFFHGRKAVERHEVVIKTKKRLGYGENYDSIYTYAEPTEPGHYAFGGTLLYTNNSVFEGFNMPVKLHDYRLDMEGR